MISGWPAWYEKICRQFDYDPNKDQTAATILNDILDERFDTSILHNIINNKTVLCVGAGPSLPSVIPIIKNTSMPIIVADSALQMLTQFKITPNIVVTDLDGQPDCMMSLADSNIIFVVHAHGDNIEKLHMARSFRRCLGTTQGVPFGRLHNFGGFTDGDRTVFLADHFGAHSIILCGMDLDGPVSPWSVPDKTKSTIASKLSKLRMASSLLEWLAQNSHSRLYTLLCDVSGFDRIEPSNTKNI